MTDKKVYIVLGIGIVLCVVAGILFANSSTGQKAFGAIGTNAVENYIPIIKYNEGYYSNLDVTTTGTLTAATSVVTTSKVGAAGTSLTLIISGTCSLIYANKSVTASTTRAFDCAIPNAVAGDKIIFQASTTTAPSLGWAITGGSASSTSAFGTLQIANMTGATAAVPNEIASSTTYWLFR